MIDQLEKRLEELKEEFENGQKMLSDLDRRKSSLKETLLRIAGAIQVLEEELKKSVNSEQDNVETFVNNNKKAQ